MVSEKSHKIDEVMDSSTEAKKWVIAGIALRAPLKPISTNPVSKNEQDQKDDHHQHECSTTPTSEDSRILSRFACPPAPKKRKASSRCHFDGVKFFNPPDFDTVFIRRAEKA